MLIGCCGPVEKYRQIANDGYDYFEALGWQIFDLGLEDFMDFVALTEEVGLPVRRISSYCGASPAIVGPRFDAAAVKAYARAMCVRAQMLGVEQIGIGSPKARQLPEGFDKAEADAQCEQFLTITANEAADYGIGIMLEGVHPGYCNYLNDTAECYAMVKRLGLPNLHLILDLYNMKRNGESWDDIRKYLDENRSMHVSTDLGGLSRGVYLASDEAEVAETMAAIKKAGWDGCVSIEPEPTRLGEGDTKTALELIRKYI
ncbi:MAG: sugar phosphate isomerase/epimerase [Firmicutes bacterium]|nr:sugar phosphate isomerase/epimerase [Bacillota bacterium]